MTFKVVNTSDWEWDQLSRYTPQVTAAMKKLKDRFPQDVDPSTLAKEIASGHRILWLILDENEHFVSFCLTAIHTVTGTDTRVCTLTSLAGDEGLSCVDDMCREIEAYAAGEGCDYTAAEGRRGWARRLASQGYKEYAVIFRKPVKRDGQ